MTRTALFPQASSPRRGRTRPISWSFSVATIGGIDVRIHATLLVLFAWIAAAYALAGAGAAGAATGVALVVCMFGAVLLHELGHALAARSFGVRTRDITLLPVGGLSRLERMPPRPLHELIVALTGPLVNLVLAGILALGLEAAGAPLLPRDLLSVGGPFAAQLLWVNLSLAAFNLLPAFPTDGGRALRAILAMGLGRTRATDIAAGIGRIFALALGLLGVVSSALLAIAAIFLYIAAGEEQRWTRLLGAVEGLPVERAMVTCFQPLDARARLAEAAARVVAGAPSDFPVQEGERLVGVLTRVDLVAGLVADGPDAPVAAFMEKDVEIVAPSEPLENAVELVRSGVPVVIAKDGELVGLLGADALPELASFAEALRPPV